LADVKALQSRAALYYSLDTDSCNSDTPTHGQFFELEEMEADAAE